MKPTDYILNWFKTIEAQDQHFIAFEIMKGLPNFPRQDPEMLISKSAEFFTNWLLEENADFSVVTSKALMAKSLINFHWLGEPTLDVLDSRHEALKQKKSEMGLSSQEISESSYPSNSIQRSAYRFSWQQLCENELSDEEIKRWEDAQFLKPT